MNLSCIIVSVSYKKGEMNMNMNKYTIRLDSFPTLEEHLGRRIVSVEFVFENCESYTVPIECFKKLKNKPLKGDKYEFKCHVVDNGKIISDSSDYTFAQRVSKYNDICELRFKHEDNTYCSMETIWYYDEEDMWSAMENNEYQKSTFCSYKEVKISIAKSNKTYTLEEVLNSKHGSRFMLNNVVYEVKNGVLWGDTYENGEIYKVVTVGLDNLDIIKGQFTKID